MGINEEEKRRIIDLYFNQAKTILEVCRIMGKSSHDVIPVIKEHRLRLAPKDISDSKEQVTQEKGSSSEKAKVIPNVKAYKLFDEGKSPLEVAAELNLPGPQVHQYYVEYWKLKHMHQLFNVYQEIQNSIGYFLKVVRLGKKKYLTPEQIINLTKMLCFINVYVNEKSLSENNREKSCKRLEFSHIHYSRPHQNLS